MSNAKKTKVNVKGTAVTVLVHREQDYISLTDIGRFKDPDRADYLIYNCFEIGTPCHRYARPGSHDLRHRGRATALQSYVD